MILLLYSMEEKYVGQRGPDKEQREFNPKSLLNLKQFQKPVPETNLSVNSGVNWTKLGIIALGFLALSIALYKKYYNKRNNDCDTRT